MHDSPRIEELKRRVQLDPASIAFAALAEEYRRAGRFAEAIATCEAGLQRHPAYLSAHVTLGRALIETGRLDEARKELEHVLRAAPENLAAIRGLADIHHRRGELPEALEQYRSALHVAKHDAELEQTVNEIAQQVEPAATETAALIEAAPEAAPAEAAPAEQASGEDATDEDTTEPEDIAALFAPPRLELVTWDRAPEPDDEPIQEDEPVEIEAQSEPIVEPEPEPESEPVPDPALAGLETFLSKILREKDHLAAGPDAR